MFSLELKLKTFSRFGYSILISWYYINFLRCRFIALRLREFFFYFFVKIASVSFVLVYLSRIQRRGPPTTHSETGDGLTC